MSVMEVDKSWRPGPRFGYLVKCALRFRDGPKHTQSMLHISKQISKGGPPWPPLLHARMALPHGRKGEETPPRRNVLEMT